MPSQKSFVETFLENIHAKVTIVKPDPGMRHPWCWNACLATNLRTDHFRQVGFVLHGIVQMPFMHAMKSLSLLELVHVERKGGLVVQFSKAPGCAFQLHRDIGELGGIA